MLIGPSGGGKSTFPACCSRGWEYPDDEILPCGQSTMSRSCTASASWSVTGGTIGTVFPGRTNLFPHLDGAAETWTLPLEKVPRNEPRGSGADTAMQTFDAFSGSNVTRTNGPAALSGGAAASAWRSRARSQSSRASCFFDEPTSALDPEMDGRRAGKVIEEFERTRGAIFVLVTHEMGFGAAGGGTRSRCWRTDAIVGVWTVRAGVRRSANTKTSRQFLCQGAQVLILKEGIAVIFDFRADLIPGYACRG